MVGSVTATVTPRCPAGPPGRRPRGYYPEFSPDGRWLAFNKSTSDLNDHSATPSSYSSASAELWLLPVDPTGSQATGPARRLDMLNSVGGVYGAASWATWAPDGSWLAFARQVDFAIKDWDVYIAAIDSVGHVSPPVALPRAASPGVGEHLPIWAP